MATKPTGDEAWEKANGLSPASSEHEAYWRRRLAGQGELKAPPKRSRLKRLKDTAEHTVREYGPARIIARNVAPLVETGDGSTVAERRERARQRNRAAREDYAAMDPADDVIDHLVDFAGGILGSAVSDPTTYVGGVGRNVGEKLVNMAGMSALADVGLQGLDVLEDVQDQYNPIQGAMNVAAPVAIHGAVRGGKRVYDKLRGRPKDEPEAPTRGGGPAEDPIDRRIRNLDELADHPNTPRNEVASARNMADKLRQKYGRGARSPSEARTEAPKAPTGPRAIADAAGFLRRFGTVTSTVRSPKKNRQVGGARNSHHLSGRAIDIARKRGVSHRQIERELRAQGYNIIESIDEGDHSHFAFDFGAKAARDARVKAKSARMAQMGGDELEAEFTRDQQSIDDIVSDYNRQTNFYGEDDRAPQFRDAGDEEAYRDEEVYRREGHTKSDPELDNSLIQIENPRDFTDAVARYERLNPEWLPGQAIRDRLNTIYDINDKFPDPDNVAEYGRDPDVNPDDFPEGPVRGTGPDTKDFPPDDIDLNRIDANRVPKNPTVSVYTQEGRLVGNYPNVEMARQFHPDGILYQDGKRIAKPHITIDALNLRNSIKNGQVRKVNDERLAEARRARNEGLITEEEWKEAIDAWKDTDDILNKYRYEDISIRDPNLKFDPTLEKAHRGEPLSNDEKVLLNSVGYVEDVRTGVWMPRDKAYELSAEHYDEKNFTDLYAKEPSASPVSVYNQEGKLVGNYRTFSEAVNLKPDHIYMRDGKRLTSDPFEMDVTPDSVAPPVVNRSKLPIPEELTSGATPVVVRRPLDTGPLDRAAPNPRGELPPRQQRLNQTNPEGYQFRFGKPTIVGREAKLSDGFGADNDQFSMHFQPMENGLWKVRAINTGDEGFPSWRAIPENDVSGYWDPKTDRFTVDAEGKQQTPITPLVRDAINKAFAESEGFRKSYEVREELAALEKERQDILTAVDEGKMPLSTAKQLLKTIGEKIDAFLKLLKDLGNDESGAFRPFGRRGYRAAAAGSAVPPSSTTPDPTLNKFYDAVKNAEKASPEQRKLYREERKKRIAEAMQRGRKSSGEKGLHYEKAALAGELPKKDIAPTRHLFTQDEVDDILKGLKHSRKLSPFESITARDSVAALLDGKLPTDGELALLYRVYPELVDAVLSKRSLSEKAKDYLLQAYETARGSMGSGDVSFAGRQGFMMVSRPEWWKAAIDQFKVLPPTKGKQVMDEQTERIVASPHYDRFKKAKIHLMDLGNLGSREEFAPKSLAEHKYSPTGPVVRASNRAYTYMANELRTKVAANILDKHAARGVDIDDPTYLKTLGEYINTFTGRGKLPGDWDRAMPFLNVLMFAPRFVLSTFQRLNPLLWARMARHPAILKEAARDSGAYLLTLFAALGLADHLGYEVVWDVKAPTGLKIKHGNTTYDIGAGMVQTAALIERLRTGKRITGKGEEVDLTEGKFGQDTTTTTIGRFLRSKAHPMLGYFIDAREGKNVVGEEFSPLANTFKLFSPMYATSIGEHVQEQGLEGAAAWFPAAFGVGINTFKPSPPKSSKKEDPFASFEESAVAEEFSDDASWAKENGLE